MQTFDANKEFESAEIAIFTKLLESYTDSIGYGTTNHILTNCTVVSQLFNDTDTILTINYSMNYTTRYQYTYDISNYPELFYESQNMTVLTEELARREFDPELVASSLLMLDKDIAITAAPVVQPTIGPSMPSPTTAPMKMMTAMPTQENGNFAQASSGDGIGESSQHNNGDNGPDLDASPSDSSPNDVPSGDSDTMQQTNDSSNTDAPLPSPGIDSLSADPEQKSTKSGLAVGVGIFVAAIFCVGLFFAWRRFKPKENATVASLKADVSVEEGRPGHQKNPSFLIIEAEGIDSPKSFSDEEYLNPLQKALSLDADLEAANSSANSFTTGATPEQQDNIVPLLLTDLDGSEDTSDEEDFDELSMSGGADIFDSYKNNQLEDLRDGVIAIIVDAESLVSLAMTASLLDDSQLTVESILDGAGDPEEIEANFLYETSDWLKKNKVNQALAAKEIFQQILNKIFVVVRNGVFMPHDAIRVVSYCAGILGLELTKDSPNDVLLVQGMRKTNDASQGRTHLVNAFKQFGIIAGAAIAVDKGFGFVRFDSPSSADSAIDRFRTGEIEVQNVSVMIERPQMTPSK